MVCDYAIYHPQPLLKQKGPKKALASEAPPVLGGVGGGQIKTIQD
jgi:hypothetical protein